MKHYTISFLYLAISIFLVSCMDDLPNECAYVYIHNETSVDLRIEGFKKGKSIKMIAIPALSTHKSLVNLFGVNTFLGTNTDLIDSVSIAFDKKKVIVQYCNGKNLDFCDNIPKNLATEFGKQNIGGGYRLFKKDGCKVFKNPIEISFDQADYEKATPFL